MNSLAKTDNCVRVADFGGRGKGEGRRRERTRFPLCFVDARPGVKIDPWILSKREI